MQEQQKMSGLQIFANMGNEGENESIESNLIESIITSGVADPAEVWSDALLGCQLSSRSAAYQ